MNTQTETTELNDLVDKQRLLCHLLHAEVRLVELQDHDLRPLIRGLENSDTKNRWPRVVTNTLRGVMPYLQLAFRGGNNVSLQTQTDQLEFALTSVPFLTPDAAATLHSTARAIYSDDVYTLDSACNLLNAVQAVIAEIEAGYSALNNAEMAEFAAGFGLRNQ